MSIFTKLLNVQHRLKAPKGQVNTFGKYKYRSCEDILEAVKPLLFEEGLTLILTDKTFCEPDGFRYIEARAIIADESGSVFEVTAQAPIDLNRKGMDFAQSSGSSSSYARKYALNGLFLIDDTKDPDATNDHGKAAQTQEVTATPKQELKEGTTQFSKAKDFIAKGGSIATIETKYRISESVKALLTAN